MEYDTICLNKKKGVIILSGEKKKQQFTILSNDSTDGHGGFGVGSISLDNISPVIVDPEASQAYVDMDAMHARSKIERRVKYYPNKEDVPEGRLYWIVWVTVEKNEQGAYYSGVCASEIRVDKPNKRAYKSMAEHVKHMEKSMKGGFELSHMDEVSMGLLGEFLKSFDEEMWKNSADELKSYFIK